MTNGLIVEELPLAINSDQAHAQYARVRSLELPGFVLSAFDSEGTNINLQVMEELVAEAGGVLSRKASPVRIYEGPLNPLQTTDLHVDFPLQDPTAANFHQSLTGQSIATFLRPSKRNPSGEVTESDKDNLAQALVNTKRWERQGFSATVNKDRSLLFIAGGLGGVAHDFVTTDYPRNSTITRVLDFEWCK